METQNPTFTTNRWTVEITVPGQTDKQGTRNDGDEPTVSFYDNEQDPERFTPLGQFVSRFYIGTLADRDSSYGLDLDMGIPEWRVQPGDFTRIQVWINDFLASY